MAQFARYAVTITANNASSLENDLDKEVNAAIDHALASRSLGVLVTRHDHASYTVEVTDEVPFGFIHERDCYSRAGQS